jgi:hypothetical protein
VVVAGRVVDAGDDFSGVEVTGFCEGVVERAGLQPGVITVTNKSNIISRLFILTPPEEEMVGYDALFINCTTVKVLALVFVQACAAGY